jgi:hypothetical protein
MSKELIAQLKQLKNGEVKPNETWVARNRALLLSQIKNTTETRNTRAGSTDMWNVMSLFLPQQMVFNVMRPVAILLVVSIVATSGWVASVDAAYNALPGDWLYPAKRAAEKTQLTVASVVGSKKTETKLHVEFAKRRATETKQIVVSADPKKQEKVKETVVDLKKEMESVNKKLEELKTVSPNSMSADAVKDLKQNTDSVKNTLQEVKESLQQSASSTTKAADVAMVSEAQNVIKETTVKAVEVIVAKHLEGDKTLSADEVKKEINNVLSDVSADAEKSKQTAESAKVIVDAVKNEVKDITAKVELTATTTMALTTQISAASTETNTAVAQTKTASDNVDKKVNEATALLDKGDLSKVIEKVKEATDIVKEGEKASDKAVIAATSVVVPVAPLVAAPVVSTQTSVPQAVMPLTTPVDPKDLKVIISTSTANGPTELPRIQVVVPAVETKVVPVQPAVAPAPTVVPATTQAPAVRR